MERIALGNKSFEGLNNAYLLEGDGEVALVDTAIAADETRQQLTARLHEAGYDFADVDAVLLTHWHFDHTGLAGEIQAASGATVYGHPGDAGVVEQDEEALEALHGLEVERMVEWGMPPDERDGLLDVFDSEAWLAGEPADVERVEDGDTVDVAGRTLEVVHAPGHTVGLCCFAFAGDDGPEAFVGDAILPVYTPNVGGADVRVDRPLMTYARTLERLAERGFARVWPGHRDPIDDPSGRAHTILQHHRDRTRRVLDAVREHGPADAWTVSAALFGDLEGIHVLHGPGEAWAHLEHLERHGLVRSGPAGYQLVDEAAEAELPELTG